MIAAAIGHAVFLLELQPYPEFALQDPRNYIFVPLLTLRRKNIVREIVKDKEEDDDEAEAFNRQSCHLHCRRLCL